MAAAVYTIVEQKTQNIESCKPCPKILTRKAESGIMRAYVSSPWKYGDVKGKPINILIVGVSTSHRIP
jgi:CxxC motif-containing protein